MILECLYILESVLHNIHKHTLEYRHTHNHIYNNLTYLTQISVCSCWRPGQRKLRSHHGARGVPGGGRALPGGATQGLPQSLLALAASVGRAQPEMAGEGGSGQLLGPMRDTAQQNPDPVSDYASAGYLCGRSQLQDDRSQRHLRAAQRARTDTKWRWWW